MNTVLVTGAAGFLGRWFVNHHLDQGDMVYGVDDLSSEHAYWPERLPGDHRLMIDAQEYFAYGKTRLGNDISYDLAYHFAAPVGGRLKIENDPLFNADSLRLDTAFFRWAIGRVGIAIYPSSSAVYPASYQEGWGRLLSEDMVHPGHEEWGAPDEMYGFTKFAGEMLAWKAARYGLNTLCIRPFSGYGEGQSMEYPIPSICARAVRKEMPLQVWGSGQQQRDFIHVKDLVGATQARLDAGIQGYQRMNICSGVGTSFIEVAKLAASIQGYDPVIKTDVSKPAGVSSRRGDPTEMLHYYTPMVSLRAGLTRVMEGID